MYCSKCGQHLADTARFCPSCGAPVTPENTVREEHGHPGEPGHAEYEYGPRTGDYGDGRWEHVNRADNGQGIYDRNDRAMNERLRRDREAQAPRGAAIASLVLGIISLAVVWLPVLPVILGLIGLICGCVGRRKGERGFSTAGITLSVLGLVFGVILTVLWIRFFLGLAANINITDISEFSDFDINIPGVIDGK